MPPLTWSLVIPTYNRLEILRAALRCVTKQTRLPMEIVIVDSSPDSDRNERIIEDEFFSSNEITRWTYVLSENRSCPIQRNEGIGKCSGDIICFIDDDTFIHPDFADIILRLYEKDAKTDIAGIQGFLTDRPHLDELTKFQCVHPVRRSLFDKLIRSLKRTRMYINWGYFLPYKGSYPRQRPIAIANDPAVKHTRTLGGGFTTYRRQVLQQSIHFDEDLLFYATGEDQDASYRASYIGAILQANKAKAYHCAFPSERPDPYVRVLTKHTNLAFWIQKHNSRSLYVKLCYFVLLGWHIPCRALDDLEERRWTLPRVRGILASTWWGFRIFLIPAASLSSWYRKFQVAIFEARGPG